MGGEACPPRGEQFSCWGVLTRAPWPVFLSEWPAPWWGSKSEPQGCSHHKLVSKDRSDGTDYTSKKHFVQVDES